MHFPTSRFIFPGLITVAGGVGLYLIGTKSRLLEFLPSSLQRLKDINFETHSVLERLTLYQDALKIMKDYPLLGAGGGAWQALYPQYQHHSYLPRQVHSFFLQYGVETGLFGLLTLFGLLAIVYIGFAKRLMVLSESAGDEYLVYYVVATSFLVHSILDFEMSFVFVSSLVFLCLGGMASALQYTLPGKLGKRLAVKSWRWTGLAAGGLLAVIVFVCTTRGLLASASYQAALKSPDRDYDAVSVQVDSALKLAPRNPQFVLTKANLLMQAYHQTQNAAFGQQGLQMLRAYREKEPNDMNAAIAEYEIRMELGQLEEALEVAKQGLASNQWFIHWHEKTISLLVQLGDQAGMANQEARKTAYWEEAESRYRTLLEQMKVHEALPEGQFHEPFGVTDPIALSMGQMYYGLGKPDQTELFLKERVRAAQPGEEELIKQITFWYLVSLERQGKRDQALHDTFFQTNPDLEQQFRSLTGGA